MSKRAAFYRAWVFIMLMGMLGQSALANFGETDAAPGSDWRKTVQVFAAEHFLHPAWGYSHCVRDYTLARELAAEDHVLLDDDVLFAAAYLHDIAAFPTWENAKLDHSDVGADIVASILKNTGFPMG